MSPHTCKIGQPALVTIIIDPFPPPQNKHFFSLGISIMILLLLTAKLKLGIIYTFTVIGKYNNQSGGSILSSPPTAPPQIVHLTRST